MELTTSQDILVRGLQKIQGIVERKKYLAYSLPFSPYGTG